MSDITQLENKYYISVNSTYADDRAKVLNHTNTFGIFDRWGDIKQLGEEVQGIYRNGTRYLSDLKLRINDKRPLLANTDDHRYIGTDITKRRWRSEY